MAHWGAKRSPVRQVGRSPGRGVFGYQDLTIPTPAPPGDSLTAEDGTLFTNEADVQMVIEDTY